MAFSIHFGVFQNIFQRTKIYFFEMTISQVDLFFSLEENDETAQGPEKDERSTTLKLKRIKLE